MRPCSLAPLAAFVAGCASEEGPPLYLNEFMASNGSSLMDETGAYPDWVEVYNAGDEAVSLGGVFLSDDPADLARAPLSDTLQIEAGGYLVLFADRGVVDDVTHLPFALSRDGEALILAFEEQSGALRALDHVVFGPQTTDVSYARAVDGEGEWQAAEEPTPGASNE